MQRRIIILSILLFGQLLSAIAFYAFIPHLLQIWYKRDLGLWGAIKAEYAQGGGMMVGEIIVIVAVLIGTIIFEVWLLVSASKAERNLIDGLKDLREHMENGFDKLSNQISKKENDETTKIE